MKAHLTIVCLCLLACSAPASGADWPHWRGPEYNGSTSETGLPAQWSQTESIRWAADLPGPAAATPIIWQDAVLISSTDPDTEQLQALCLERRTGQVRWQHDVERGIRRDYRSTFAAPSPVTDGRVAIYFYSTGTLIAFDLDGQRLWRRNLQQDHGEFAFLWTFSASPLLYDGTLYVQVLQRDVPVRGRESVGTPIDSYLLAIDPQTGQDKWKRVRPSRAVAESREAFSSPIPFQTAGRREILVAGGDALTGHDPSSGRELWRWGTWNPQRIPHWRLVPSPVTGDGVILLGAPKRAPIYAIQAGGEGRLGDDALAWVSRNRRVLSTDVPTPAFYDGDFFVLSDVRGALSRIEPQSGRIRWTIETPGRTKYEASPLAADGKIYLMNFDGLVVVVDAGDGTVISEIPMAEGQRAGREAPIRSSIAAAAGNLFIRTNEKLYCVGQGDQ